MGYNKTKFRLHEINKFEENCCTTSNEGIIKAEKGCEKTMFHIVEYHGSVKISSTSNDSLPDLDLNVIPLEQSLSLADKIELEGVESVELKTEIFVL